MNEISFYTLEKGDTIQTRISFKHQGAFQIPVICVMEKGSIHDHSMLRYACGFIVNTLEEAIDLTVAVLGPDSEL